MAQGRVVQEFSSTNHTPLAVPTLLRALWSIEPEFADGGMHDAHDFWLLAIEALTHHPGHTSLSQRPPSIQPYGDGVGGQRLTESLFKGVLQTTLSCEVCGYTSRIDETFVDHSLSLHSVTPKKPNAKGDVLNGRDRSSNATSTLEAASSPTTSPSRNQQQEEWLKQPERHSLAGQRIRKKALRRCGRCAACSHPKRKKGCLRNKVSIGLLKMYLGEQRGVCVRVC